MISRYVYCIHTECIHECAVFKHEFVFASLWYVNNSCVNTARACFPCTNLHDCKFLLVTVLFNFAMDRLALLSVSTFWASVRYAFRNNEMKGKKYNHVVLPRSISYWSINYPQNLYWETVFKKRTEKWKRALRKSN